MTCRYFFWFVLDVKPRPFHFQKLNQWTRTGGCDPTCVFSRALIGLFVLLIRGIGSGLHSWVNLSPQKTYRNDLLLQVMCTIFASMLTEVLRVLPCVYMYVRMYAYASMTTASSVALCHKYKAFLVDGVSSYSRALRLARVDRNVAFSASKLRASSGPDPGQK